MRAKEYLREIRRLEICCRQKREEIEILRDQATCLRSVEIQHDKIQTTPDGQGFTRFIDRAAEMEAELTADLERLQEIRHERIQMIQRLDNAEYIDLLYMYYVLNKSMSYIADYIGHELSYTYNMHLAALEEFEKKFPEILEM